jgi:hypothetical protein
MTDTQADFLKRKNRFDEDLGHTVGMLDENSIFKSLHSILKSKVVTPMEVASQNIDGALREWFFHGRDTFEMRRSQMIEVQQKSGAFATTLDQSFDDRVADWKLKYEAQSGEVSKTRTFDIDNRSCSTTASGCIAFNYAKGGKIYEYLYVGCGVFISSRNIMRFTTLIFDGCKYPFEYLVPVEESLDGILNVYYVDALKDVASCVPLYTGVWEKSAIVSFDDMSTVTLKPTVCKGRDDGRNGSMSPAAAERLYGVSKFKLPSGKSFGSAKFLNEIVSVTIKGSEYPAYASYHARHDPKRSKSVGSVRLISSRAFVGREYVLA